MLKETLKPKLQVQSQKMPGPINMNDYIICQALQEENERLRRLLNEAQSPLSSLGNVEPTMLPDRTMELEEALDIEVCCVYHGQSLL
jgi:hypothetical protein